MNAIRAARSLSGLTQAELARRAGTSRPTLSAYERGEKTPTLATFLRLLDAAGLELRLERPIVWREEYTSRGRPFSVPSRLPQLSPEYALRRGRLPLHLDWSTPRRRYDLTDRQQRGLVYETVLREGAPADISDVVDGALLVDLWPDIVLPREIRSAWEPLVTAALTRGSAADDAA